MQTPNKMENEKRYIFTNWSKEDFLGQWDGATTLVKAGEYIEVPEYLAFHFCKVLVDREMLRNGQETMMANEEARDPHERKTIVEIKAGIDSPAMVQLKEKIRQEIEDEKAHKEPGDKVSGKKEKKDGKKDGEKEEAIEFSGLSLEKKD